MNVQLHKFTRTQQSGFASYVRTGIIPHLEGLTNNRVHHYRRLVFNVVNDSLQSAFPITYDLLEENEWEELVDNFFGTHACQSYQIWKMPFEFYEYVLNSKTKLEKKYPHLLDLLLFEWSEIEVYMMEDAELSHYNKRGDLLKDVILFNAEHKLLKLGYPVHLKNANEISRSDNGEYYVLLFREPETFKVRFVDLSVYFAWLIEEVKKKSQPLESILDEAEKIFPADKKTLLEKTIPFLNEMFERKFLVGFKK